MTVRSGLIAALLGVAGCQGGTAIDSAKPDEDTCGAAALQRYIGQPATVDDFAMAGRPVRVIPDMGAVTTDYVPNRLNVELDKTGLIKRIYCG